MIIEGSSPTMRHVSRTHRVALDWLFDRINLDLDQKIQIKNVDTKHNSQTYWQRAISHVMSGTIFSICVTSAISGQFAALRISALPAAQKRWRTGCNKDTEKRELWQSRSRRLNLVSKTEATSATVLSPNASNRPGILGAPCQYDWKSTRNLLRETQIKTQRRVLKCGKRCRKEREYEESRRNKEWTRIFKLQRVEETRSVHGGKLRIRRR